MKAHGKTSKLARALEKDLQGDQVVYKHFQEGKISISGDRRGRHSSAVDSPWNRAGIWKVFALLVLLILSAAILEKKYKNHVLIKHPVNQGRTAKMVAMNVPAVTNNQNAASVSPKSRPVIATRMQVKIKPERSPCMLRESSYGTVTFSFDRELAVCPQLSWRQQWKYLQLERLARDHSFFHNRFSRGGVFFT